MMCNKYTGEHNFKFSGNNTNSLPPPELLCECGGMRFDEFSIVERKIAGLTEEQWKERYIAYMKKYNVLDWQAKELADVSWDESTDETPEECADAELDCFE